MAKNDNANIQSGDVAEALGLLTRFPVTADGQRGVRAAWAWPLAGGAVGLLAGFIAAVAVWAGVPPSAAAGIALTVQIMGTGAMHEDGLADCADGFWGGSDTWRRLDIMKDSAIGSFGTLALILSVMIRWSLLATLFASGSVIVPLVTAAALSRVPLVALMFTMEPARTDGLSVSVGRPSPDTFILAGTVALIVGFVFTGFATLPAAFAAGCSALVVARIAIAKIGGQTGDVLGASQQIAEIAVLLALVIVPA